MASERRKQILLTCLAVALAAVMYRAWSTTSATTALTSNGGPAGRTPANANRAATSAANGEAPDVHLRKLGVERPKQLDADRNVFRFKPKAVPPPPPRVAAPTTGPSAPGPPPGPPPPPAIALKFIGIVERPERSEKFAVLRDAVGHVFSGSEGAIIEGRFLILRIGTESIEMAYLDGRGRQTIRLSGG
jgi:hypothetical protein